MHKDMEERQSAHERFPEKNPTTISQVADDMITIDGRRYRLIKDYKDALHKDRLAERYEQVLDKYDYIVGDWGFEQLRLKGFYKDKRRQAAPDQKIGHLQDYIYEYCNFGCAYFVLERLDAPEPVEEPRRRPTRPHQSTNHRSESGSGEPKHERSGESRPHHSRRGKRGGRHQRDHKPYTEKRVTEKRPERGQHQKAKDSGSKTNRHFNIRTIDDTNI